MAGKRDNVAVVYSLAVSVAYVAATLAVMCFLSPTVPYADQWRHYARLLEAPLSLAVFTADNGHAEVLPNLVRLVALRFFDGNEIFEISVGIVLLLATTIVLLRLVWRDSRLDRTSKARVTSILILGLFWLGNVRALAHDNESVHAYSVTFFVALALLFSLDIRGRTRYSSKDTVLLAVCCASAAISFGSGFAVFPAVACVFFIQHEPPVRWVMLCVVAAITYLCYSVLPDSHGGMLDFSGHSMTVLVQWIGAPVEYVVLPIVDPSIAAKSPGVVRALTQPISAEWTQLFGLLRQQVWPQAIVGCLGVLAFAVSVWRLRKCGRATTSTARVGASLSAFGLCVGILVAVTRSPEFFLHPEQVYAPRYLPWSSLFWSGLLVTCLARVNSSRTVAAAAMFLPFVLLPSEAAMGMLARHIRVVAEETALHVLVGVLPAQSELGETNLEDVQRALPLLRASSTSIFRTPEARSLGQHIDASDTHETFPRNEFRADKVENLLPGEGTAVTLLGRSCRSGLSLVAVDDVIVGLSRRDANGSCAGVIRGPLEANSKVCVGSTAYRRFDCFAAVK